MSENEESRHRHPDGTVGPARDARARDAGAEEADASESVGMAPRELEGESDADAGDGPEGVVVSLLAPDVEGDYAVFVSLEDGLLLVEEYEGSSDLTGFAETIERRLAAPYRARALRVDERRFVVVAREIETVELPALKGEELLVVALPGEEPVAIVDGHRTALEPSELDPILGESQPCLARLVNLDESVWELTLELL
jgi:hypothetical protein